MSSELTEIIDELNSVLLESHSSDSRLFAELIGAQSELGLLFGSRPTCPYLRPHLMSRTLYDEISTASKTVAEAAQIVADAALEDDGILGELGLTKREQKLARIDPGYKELCVSSRLDAFIDGSEFKFLEYNAETPAGVGDQMQIEVVLGKIPEIRRLLSATPHWRPKPHQKLLRALFNAYRETGGRKRKPNIAIVDWEGVETESEFYILKDYFESMGFPTMVVDPHELEYDGQELRAGSFQIDIVYKRVLIHELLEKFEDSHPLIRAYSDSNICLANSFRTKLAHKKSLFAVFTDDRFKHLFSSEQLETFRRHIPWTRRVSAGKTSFHSDEIDLPEYLQRYRERFLLKPNDDYGGQGITLGWEVSEAIWEDALETALNHPFVVQERAAIAKQVFPVFSDKMVSLEKLLVDYDPFLFQNEVEGGLVRLSSAALVNVTQGGGQTALIVLEDY